MGRLSGMAVAYFLARVLLEIVFGEIAGRVVDWVSLPLSETAISLNVTPIVTTFLQEDQLDRRRGLALTFHQAILARLFQSDFPV